MQRLKLNQLCIHEIQAVTVIKPLHATSLMCHLITSQAKREVFISRKAGISAFVSSEARLPTEDLFNDLEVKYRPP